MDSHTTGRVGPGRSSPPPAALADARAVGDRHALPGLLQGCFAEGPSRFTAGGKGSHPLYGPVSVGISGSHLASTTHRLSTHFGVIRPSNVAM